MRHAVNYIKIQSVFVTLRESVGDWFYFRDDLLELINKYFMKQISYVNKGLRHMQIY